MSFNDGEGWKPPKLRRVKPDPYYMRPVRVTRMPGFRAPKPPKPPRHPRIRKCPVCGMEFAVEGNRIYCSRECRDQAVRARRGKYRRNRGKGGGR